jgi:hypothetical protein
LNLPLDSRPWCRFLAGSAWLALGVWAYLSFDLAWGIPPVAIGVWGLGALPVALLTVWWSRGRDVRALAAWVLLLGCILVLETGVTTFDQPHGLLSSPVGTLWTLWSVSLAGALLGFLGRAPSRNQRKEDCGYPGALINN